MAELPHWQPLNGVAPPVAESGGTGKIVVLVASERAASEGWGAQAAVDLARSWASQGQRVMLVDGGLDSPSLHTVAGVANREGLSDATLYGASVARVSQQVADGGFFLITAGTPVADAQAVVRSSRWYRFSSGIIEAGVTLALYVRDGEAGAAAFLGSASDIIVLAASDEPPPGAVRDLEPLVRAVAGPGDGGPAPAGAPDGEVVPHLPDVDGEEGVEVGVEVGSDLEHVPTPGVVPEVGDGKGSVGLLLLLIIAIVVAGVLGYVFWSGGLG